MYAGLTAARTRRQAGDAACLEGLAGVAGGQGQPEQAGRLFAAAEALRASLGTPLPPVERAEYACNVAAARGQRDEATWEAAWAEGRAMTLEQAISPMR